jgi:thiol-disulfide isomerase/thioredoxin
LLGSLPILFCSTLMTLAPAAGAEVPRPSPEYAIRLTTGQQLLLSQYRGKVVALMFVYTTCSHCQETCQLVEKLDKEYGPRGFQPLAVAFNDMAVMLVPDFIKQYGLSFPVGYDTRDPVFAYLERSPALLTSVPIMVFVDKRGVIRGQSLGDPKFFAPENREKNIRTMIEQLLKEPAGRKSSPATAKAPPTKKKTS